MFKKKKKGNCLQVCSFLKNESKSYNGENLVSEQTKEADIRKLFSFSMKNL